MNEASAATDALPRRLGVVTATATIVGLSIGSGIFFPTQALLAVNSVNTVMALWLIGGLVTLCLALSLAELSGMFPRAGGIYVYLREAYGPMLAFVFGWTVIIVIPAGWSAISLVFAKYLNHFVVTLTDLQQRLVAVGLIVAIASANYRSVNLAAAIQNLATSAKILALLGLATLICFFGKPHGPQVAAQIAAQPLPLSALGVALIGIFWTYEGQASVCAIAGEVRNAERNFPRALIAAVLIIIVLYLLVNAAYFYALTLDEARASHLIAADAMQSAIGSRAADVISALVMLSTFGAVAATALSDPRVFFAMAQEKLFFDATGRVHPKFRTPHIAVALITTLACMMVLLQTFDQLTHMFVIGFWPFYALAVAGIFVLRRRRPEIARPYRVHGYPWVPAVFILSALLLVGNALVQAPWQTLKSLGWSIAGIPVYLLWKRWRKT
ncbi:MAG: APC family permease [Steroidobacteraceae bacterium]